MEHPTLEQQALVQSSIESFVNSFLAHVDHRLRERRDLRGHLHRLVHQLVLGKGKTRRCPLQTRFPILGGHFGRVLQSVVNRLCVFLDVPFYRKISALHISAKLAREPQTGLPLAAGSVDLRK